MVKMIDMTGMTFTRLTVLGRSGSTPTGMAAWLCRCSCGTEKRFYGADLRSGKSKSCGCLKSEIVGSLRRSHNQSKTRLYRIWQGMLKRCFDKNQPGYKDYGAKGISVCNEWRDFNKFYDWSKLNGYNESLSIDRIDNKLGYFPENCRWATPREQAINRRTTTLTSDGRPGLLVAEENGISPRLFRSRVDAGWDIDLAAVKPLMRKKKILP